MFSIFTILEIRVEGGWLPPCQCQCLHFFYSPLTPWSLPRWMLSATRSRPPAPGLDSKRWSLMSGTKLLSQRLPSCVARPDTSSSRMAGDRDSCWGWKNITARVKFKVWYYPRLFFIKYFFSFFLSLFLSVFILIFHLFLCQSFFLFSCL